MKSKVKWKSCLSDSFNVLNGIKQGGVISPILFSLYIDKLIDLVHNSNFGCYIGDVPSSIFIYADDIVLLSPTRYGMKQILRLCEEFGVEYGLKFNPDKCESVTYSNTNNLNDKLMFELNGKSIKFVENVKHLGHDLISKKCKFNFEPILNDIKSKTNGILNVFNHISIDARLRLFNSFCTSYYGSILCSLNDLDKIDVVWRVCVRRILKVNSRTRSYLLPALTNMRSAKSEIEKRMLLFFIDGLNHDSEIIEFYFRNCLCNESSTMYKNVKNLTVNNDMFLNRLKFYSKNFIKTSFKNTSIKDWRSNMVMEMLKILDGDFIIDNFDISDLKNIFYYLCTY